MVAGVIHISDQFELNQESAFAAEQDHEKQSTTTVWNTNQPEVGKCQEDDSRYFLFADFCKLISLLQFRYSVISCGWWMHSVF